MERSTRQRQAIARALKRAGRPLAREELLALARKEIPSLGKATVDRYLRERRAKGRVVGIDYPGQPIRFELATGKDAQHFICRVCDQLFELDMPPPDVEVRLPEGYRLAGYEVVLYGTCPACAAKGEA